MIRPLSFLALGVAIWIMAYQTPGHTGGWGVVRGLMISIGSLMAGFQAGKVESELRWRVQIRWHWWRNRHNARRGRGHSKGGR